MAIIDTAPAEKTLFGHPTGLTWLFTTEMWERFSYYGMRVLLPIYLTGYLLLPGHAEHVIGYHTMKHFLEGIRGPLGVQPLESMIYSLYTGFVYFTPLIGGFLADRFFGRRYTVVIGGLLMAIGHFMMAFENYFFFALLFLILGNGGFKPNISSQVGGLYKPGDQRIDRAYSIFYVGINLGAFLGQEFAGNIGEGLAWRYGFGSAGVAMLIGTITYLFAMRQLPNDRPSRTKVVAAAVPRTPLTRRDWWAVALLCLFFIPCTLFWATYEQSGNTVELWTRDLVDRSVGGLFEISVTTLQSVNPVMIFTFTAGIVALWSWQQRRGKEPSIINKMALGCTLIALSYLLLAGVQYLAGPTGKVYWVWAIVYFGVLTVGELYFSPVGLSLYAKAAPRQLGSLMMAVFLATSFPGNLLAGYIGSYWDGMNKVTFFLMIAAIIGAAVPVILLFNIPIRRLVASQHEDNMVTPEAPYQAPPA
ncbi:MAG TPA: peptide MFS transporter [Rhizomicrobium sp.]|jgi:POT family proton-dependent oligopeptide transporter|nr:peptide MFS transporter [Rhizomicrobium sp.]